MNSQTWKMSNYRLQWIKNGKTLNQQQPGRRSDEKTFHWFSMAKSHSVFSERKAFSHVSNIRLKKKEQKKTKNVKKEVVERTQQRIETCQTLWIRITIELITLGILDVLFIFESPPAKNLSKLLFWLHRYNKGFNPFPSLNQSIKKMRTVRSFSNFAHWFPASPFSFSYFYTPQYARKHFHCSTLISHQKTTHSHSHMHTKGPFLRYWKQIDKWKTLSHSKLTYGLKIYSSREKKAFSFWRLAVC